jgi:hypothetical protein
MDDKFARLNAFGEVVGKPTDRPTSRIGANNQRQVGVLYGHNNGGKVYTYLAGANVRTGDTVTPEVTHYKSGKTYKTLGRVVSTRNSLGSTAGDTATHLAGQAILMKTLGPTDQTGLPGYRANKERDPNFTAKQWAQEAREKYDNAVMRRLGPMGTPTEGNKL